MRRQWLETLRLWGILVMLLGLVGLAWLSGHPDSPILDRAAEWPVVGEWAARFEDHFGRASASRTDARSSLAEAPAAGEELGAEGPAVETIYVGPRPRVWVRQDQALFAQPDRSSMRVAIADAYANVPFLEQRGEWYRVDYREVVAWAHVPSPGDSGPLLGSDPLPATPLPGAEAEPEVLDIARDVLGGTSRDELFGPYRVVTDVEDQELLAICRRAGESIEPVYAARYGVEPIDRARETILLFADEADFHRFRREHRDVGGWASGYASLGLVALFVGDRSAVEVVSTLVHEIVHLLNRRAIGPALPPWLNEGLATDLGQSRADVVAGIEPETLSHDRRETPGGYQVFGGRAHLELLRVELADGRLPSIREALAGEWPDGGDSRDYYPRVGFFVRYLLSGDPGLATGLRSYLRAVSEGAPASPELLVDSLDADWDSLDRGFHAWLRSFPEPSGGEIAAAD